MNFCIVSLQGRLAKGEWMEKKDNLLSKRMQMVADMVTPGNVLADIGCDHGFVSIYLVENKICPKVIAMDVNEGPLLRAKEHIEERELTEYIDIRLSDGMEKLAFGEADGILTAGMGGRLVTRILSDYLEKAKALKEVILQPQSELHIVRNFLTEQGFHILKEDMVEENGKYYPAIRAAWQSGPKQELSQEQQWYGPYLLKAKHPVLLEYLQREKCKFIQIQEEIDNSSKIADSTNREAIISRIRLINSALTYFN